MDPHYRIVPMKYRSTADAVVRGAANELTHCGTKRHFAATARTTAFSDFGTIKQSGNFRTVFDFPAAAVRYQELDERIQT
jgi:hypothetical protein